MVLCFIIFYDIFLSSFIGEYLSVHTLNFVIELKLDRCFMFGINEKHDARVAVVEVRYDFFHFQCPLTQYCEEVSSVLLARRRAALRPYLSRNHAPG